MLQPFPICQLRQIRCAERMNFLKADTGGFNRLLASVGLILIAMALVVPWAFLRDTTALEIKQSDLAAYTPRAASVLRQRQHRIAQFQTATPWLSGVLIVGGVTLLIIGAKGMKELQPWETREIKARAQQAEANIEPQTPDDRSVRTSIEALDRVGELLTPAIEEEVLGESTSTAVEPSGANDDAEVVAQRRVVRSVVAEAIDLEREVYERLGRIQFVGYDFRAQVRVVAPAERPLLLDGLLRATREDRPDVILELKYMGRPLSAGMSRAYMDRALATAARYEQVANRKAVPWLLIVLGPEVPRDHVYAAALQWVNDELAGRGFFTVVPRETLDRLQDYVPVSWVGRTAE